MPADNIPKSWDLFNEFLEGLEDRRQEEIRGAFPRFQARYRAARSMKIELDGYVTEDTPSGYVAIVHCGMAYSVLESLEKAINGYAKIAKCEPDNSHRRVRVESPEIANYYRADGSKRLRDAMKKHLDSNKLVAKLTELEVSGDDVTPLAAGIRHLAFHGVFTPGTIGYKRMGKNASVAKLMNQLPAAILDATDDHFTTWCALIKAHA
ncbi:MULTISPECIES: hypothetical protein [Brevibacterium]|uniref:Uncharacterized protein n=1 Tax=Brevibacterium paucivorans TaxID=170994 RepID=A0A2N6VKT9_9MICO|nr:MULTISPECIES: hypothetical protein [Brevibacterium]MCG7297996.1 hypothetical protein [Brevibacterium sp. ACRRH]PMD04771.1 hypothetical protein CJ199_10425 [Brevibacterium paucivorans]